MKWRCRDDRLFLLGRKVEPYDRSRRPRAGLLSFHVDAVIDGMHLAPLSNNRESVFCRIIQHSYHFALDKVSEYKPVSGRTGRCGFPNINQEQVFFRYNGRGPGSRPQIHRVFVGIDGNGLVLHNVIRPDRPVFTEVIRESVPHNKARRGIHKLVLGRSTLLSHAV